MPHDTPLITTIVAALVLAYLLGSIANRLRMPPIVGYLIAGVVVGPHSPGFVADTTLAPQLAEIGVILLMFGIGLHFSLRDLLSVRAVAIPGALIRMAVAAAMGVGLGLLLGWPVMGGLVFGLALAVSSTVVTLKVLQDRHLVDSDRGRIAMGWLVVEDLAMVLALVLIPAFAGATALGGAGGVAGRAVPDAFVALTEQLLNTRLELWAVLGLTLLKLLAFVGFMVVVGRRVIPFILHATAHTGSRELFRLAVLAIALGVAAGAAYLFGVSLALGAFFAGMILSESELSQRAAQETLPLRDAFGVLFFVSVGMLFDPAIVVDQPLRVMATLAIILFGKSIVGFLLLLLFGRPIGGALQISAILAQIGEFSFILAAMGVSLGVLPEEGRSLILAGSIISIVLNPLVFWLAERLRPRLEARARTEPELGPVVPERAEEAAAPLAAEAAGEEEAGPQPTQLANHVVLIGYGRVGSVVAGELAREGAPFLLIEDAEGRIEAARALGIEVITGNAATRETLLLANVMGARCVVIAIPNAFEAGQATEQCRKLNAGVKIIARAHSDEEVDYLRRLGADEVIMGEREIGLGMIDWLRGTERREAGPRLNDADNLLQRARAVQPGAAPGVALQPEPDRVAVATPAPASEETPMPVTAPRPADAEIRPPHWPPVRPPQPEAPPPASPRFIAAGAAEAATAEAAIWAATVGANGAAEAVGRIANDVADRRPAPTPAPASREASPERQAGYPEAPAAGGSAAIAEPPVQPMQPMQPVPPVPPVAPVPPEPPVPPAPAAERVPATGAARSMDVPAEARPEAPPVAGAEAPRHETPAVATPEGPAVAAHDGTAARPDTPAADPPPGVDPWAPEPHAGAEATAARRDGPSATEPRGPAGGNPAGPGVPQGMSPPPGETRAADAAQRAGFRVVSPAEIIILPPEPTTPPADAGAPEPTSYFHSEFWADEELPRENSDEPQLFPLGTGPTPARLRSVQEPEPPPVDDSAWLAALERDLFGGAGEPAAPPGRPDEVPPPTPQPLETPQPQEDPLAPPQPLETPQPREDPLAPAQPIETPQPQEIPATVPSPAPPAAPPTRAGDRREAD